MALHWSEKYNGYGKILAAKIVAPGTIKENLSPKQTINVRNF